MEKKVNRKSWSLEKENIEKIICGVQEILRKCKCKANEILLRRRNNRPYVPLKTEKNISFIFVIACNCLCNLRIRKKNIELFAAVYVIFLK